MLSAAQEEFEVRLLMTLGPRAGVVWKKFASRWRRDITMIIVMLNGYIIYLFVCLIYVICLIYFIDFNLFYLSISLSPYLSIFLSPYLSIDLLAYLSNQARMVMENHPDS